MGTKRDVLDSITLQIRLLKKGDGTTLYTLTNSRFVAAASAKKLPLTMTKLSQGKHLSGLDMKKDPSAKNNIHKKPCSIISDQVASAKCGKRTQPLPHYETFYMSRQKFFLFLYTCLVRHYLSWLKETWTQYEKNNMSLVLSNKAWVKTASDI